MEVMERPVERLKGTRGERGEKLDEFGKPLKTIKTGSLGKLIILEDGSLESNSLIDTCTTEAVLDKFTFRAKVLAHVAGSKHWNACSNPVAHNFPWNKPSRG